jgi:hypothetical protein
MEGGLTLPVILFVPGVLVESPSLLGSKFSTCKSLSDAKRLLPPAVGFGKLNMAYSIS